MANLPPISLTPPARSESGPRWTDTIWLALCLAFGGIPAFAFAQTSSSTETPLPKPEPGMNAEQVFATVCATCHGAEGEGKKEVLAPSIAGQPDWFVALQLEKFRVGHRGAGEETDPSGELMRAIALALTAQTIPDLATYVSELDPVPTTTEMKGDATRGEAIFMETCAACHRYSAQGEKVFRSAPLTSLPDWYIAASIRKFQDGVRGYQHGDLEGPKMREIAERIGEEQIADLIVHIAALAEKYPPGETRRGPRQVPEFKPDPDLP